MKNHAECLNGEFSLNPSSVVSDSGVGCWRSRTARWVNGQNSDKHVLAPVRDDKGIADVTLAAIRSFDVVFSTESKIIVPDIEAKASCCCSRSLIAAIQEVVWSRATDSLEAEPSNLTLFVFEWKDQIRNILWWKLDRMNVCSWNDWIHEAKNGDVVVSVLSVESRVN